MMFQPFGRVTGPYFPWIGELTQVINMPALGFVRTEMSGNACLYAARPKSAANVDVVSWLDLDLAPAANLYPGYRVIQENKGICSRIWFNHVSFPPLYPLQRSLPGDIGE